MKFINNTIALLATFVAASLAASAVPEEAATADTTTTVAEVEQRTAVTKFWPFFKGGDFCYTQPIFPLCPRPQRPCLLPMYFGENIASITCVPGTYLRSGEHCHVGCSSQCDIAKSKFFEDEPITNAYKCIDGHLITPNLQCLDPIPPPPPPPKPIPRPIKGCCRGPSGEWLEHGRTYAVKPAGECKDKCTTMWAWCDPVNPGAYNYCCGAYCQRVFMPPPCFKKPKYYDIWDF